MATLGEHLLDFYGSVAPLSKQTVAEAMATWPRELVIQWLNQGWARAAEDCGGIQITTKHNLTANKETYSLSAATLSVSPIISLLKVILLKSGDVVARLTPSYAPDIEFPDGTVESGLPVRCSWKIQKHDATTAIYELRLSPPSDWTEVSGLWTVCSVRPAEITGDTDSPDVLDTMGRMGVDFACYKATRQPTFLQGYTDGKRLLGKSGLENQPVMKKKSFWAQRGNYQDPRISR